MGCVPIFKLDRITLPKNEKCFHPKQKGARWGGDKVIFSTNKILFPKDNKLLR